MARGGLATQYAPSFRLIQAHFGLGVLGLLAFSTALLVRAPEVQGYFFQPVLLGLVHLCVLGFLMPIAIGALHQLVPVVFEVPVRSEGLAWAGLALYAVAAPVFILQMWTLRTGLLLPVAATGAALALWAYAANLIGTILGSQARTLTGWYVIAALLWLPVAASLGAALALNLYAPYLPISHLAVLRMHAHAAGAGFFGLLIMGVAYRLLEMFLLSHGAREHAGWVAFGAMHGALFALLGAFTFPAQSGLLYAGAGLAPLAVAASLFQVRLIYRRRTNRRTEVAWRHSFTSFVYLAAACGVGSVLAVAPEASPWAPRAYLVYGLLALPGFMGTIVVGQMYKILPFLVWLHRFSAFVGLKRVPSASELLAERPKQVQYLLMHTGLAALILGVLLDVAVLRSVGAAAFLGSSALFARNLGVISMRKP